MKDIQVNITYTVTLKQVKCEHEFDVMYGICNECLMLKRTWFAVKDTKQYKVLRAQHVENRQKD